MADFPVDILLWVMYLALLAAIVVAVASVVRSLRTGGGGPVAANGVPAGRVAWTVAGLWALTIALTLALGSDKPLQVNGAAYTEAVWLRLTDMFINTAIVLAVVAVAAAVFTATGLNRRWNGRKRRTA